MKGQRVREANSYGDYDDFADNGYSGAWAVGGQNVMSENDVDDESVDSIVGRHECRQEINQRVSVWTARGINDDNIDQRSLGYDLKSATAR